MKKMIEENPIAFATTNDGKPHVIVVADVKVVSDNQILIGDNYMKTTVENIKQNPNVSLVVHNNKEGYGFDGKAEYFTEGKWFDKVKEIHEGYPAKGAILINIEEIKKSLCFCSGLLDACNFPERKLLHRDLQKVKQISCAQDANSKNIKHLDIRRLA